MWRHIELQLWPTELVEWDQNKQKYTRRRKLQKDSSHSLDPQLIYNQIISKMTPEQKSRWAYVYMLHTGLICYPIIDFVDAVHTRAKANLSEPEIPGEKLKSYVYAVQQAVQFHFNDNFNMDTPHKNGCYFFAPAIAKFTYEGFVLNNVNNIPLFSEPFPLLTPMKSNLDLIWDGKTTGRWAKTSDIDYYLNPKLYIPFNHQNIFGSVLIKLYKVLDENSALYWPLSEYKNQYKNRAIELTRHFKNYLHPAQAKENTYIWAYNVPYDIYGENPLQEDADHARLDLEFAALAERYLPGSAISKEDLIKFANTVKQVMYNTRTYHVNILIDGSHSAESTKNGDGYMGEEGFMYLTEYDNDLYKYYSETYRRYYFPLPLDFIDENKLAFMKALANFHIFSENPESY
ncbi:MAG: hypothetical protein Kow0042_08050 [Calditrichia bacterium]